MNVSGQWIRLKSAVDVRLRPKCFRVFRSVELSHWLQGVTFSLGIYPCWIKSLLIFQEAHSPIPVHRLLRASSLFLSVSFSLLYSFFPSSSLLPFLVLQLCLARRISLPCFSSLLTRNHYQLRLSGRILHFRRFLYCGRPRRPSKQTAKGPFSTLSGFVQAHLLKKFSLRPFSFPFHFDRSMGQMRMEQVVEFDFRRMIYVPLEIVTRRRFNNSTEINV